MATSLIPLKQQKRLVTYYVDTGTVYTAKVKKKDDALLNLAFTPSKSGWTFAGWREDTTASGTVLSSEIVGKTDIVLYAVFSQTVTLTYYNGTSSTASTSSGKRYYNNGNITNPKFTLTASSVSGWTFSGWCTSSSATATVAYSSINNTEFSASTTLYSKYYQTITLTYYSSSSTASTKTGTRYYNHGNYSNPTFTISSPSVSGWTFLGWISGSTSATGTVSYTSISSTTFSASATLYAKFSQTITLSYNGNSATSGSTSSQTGTRYWNAYGNYSNPTFTLASNGYTRTLYTFSKWAKGSTSGTQYSAGASVSLSANTTFYAIWTANACRLTIAASHNESFYTDQHQLVYGIRFVFTLYTTSSGSTVYKTSTVQLTRSGGGSGSSGSGSFAGILTYSGTSGDSNIDDEGNADGWHVATITASKTLYTNTGLSTVGLASGSSLGFYSGYQYRSGYVDLDTSSPSYTYYVSGANVS